MIDVKEFFDDDTATLTYVVIHRPSNQCVIIDPVLNYDQSSGSVSTLSADLLLDYLTHEGLSLRWLLETHIHADHLTASMYLKQRRGGLIAIGAHIRSVLNHWIPLLNIAHDTSFNASQFDVLLEDGDKLPLGDETISVLHTPGHTPSCVSYLIGGHVFVGDALFQPDVGTGRADFPGGDAALLYDSIQRILNLPETTTIYSCHDYPPAARTASGASTVLLQKKQNILVKAGVLKENFVDVRTKRDTGKPVPKLLYPSIQVNLRGGTFGRAESNGSHFIKIPVDNPVSCLPQTIDPGL